ncbi:hypothetical protein LY01_00657 [Nonlabens xylanidelens]|uniref:Threonine synthase n=1 Tax=Nonlabens xylanidelens TaxID=191564 RepID=A0A2S6IRD7_9FLAO|nr:DUF6503 family protein [Nonlabens xylanidelens]PPK96832.1 hypothetical protein LY01_00657 [Nonlabens xylanidelens]PQJ13532.1 threonine synthase [Nonlabens xylanidelens]
MKKIILALFVATLMVSCKTEEKKEVSVEKETVVEKTMVDLSRYPQGLKDVLAAHGGLQKWSEMRSLTYSLDETETIADVQTRDIVVKSPTHTIGSLDGKVWIAQDSAYFPEARAKFYHNLMFYFYSMPFLLADSGIVYEDVEPLEFDGVTYPGIKVGFEAAVGDSPDDNYLMYYHPETKKMTWLAYTVTAGNRGKSDKFNFVNYNEWNEVNGLLLPTQLTWYKVENNKPTVPAGKVREFKSIDIDGGNMDTATYAKPENGVYVD